MLNAIMKKHLGERKGFTLVEVVVVLVILAILAAIAVPALTGYIDDAEKRSVTTEARSALVGLQHLASSDKTDNGVATPGLGSDGYFTAGGLSTAGQTQIGELTGDTTIGTKINSITLSGTRVTGFNYRGDKYTVTYASGVFKKPVLNPTQP